MKIIHSWDVSFKRFLPHTASSHPELIMFCLLAVWASYWFSPKWKPSLLFMFENLRVAICLIHSLFLKVFLMKYPITNQRCPAFLLPGSCGVLFPAVSFGLLSWWRSLANSFWERLVGRDISWDLADPNSPCLHPTLDSLARYLVLAQKFLDLIIP